MRVGIPSPDIAGQDEWDLDSQTSTGIAQTVKHLYFYDTTSLSDSDVALMFNRFAAQNYAQIGNASFGLCEVFAYLDGSMLADDEVFLQAAAQGQTVFPRRATTARPVQSRPPTAYRSREPWGRCSIPLRRRM